ncbi:MAG: hypothetical protein LAKADJCE_00268 [Candidatus Argoarchaeum ethanivorans]|uniref:Uncharacterized protein n=1 Tax=Candidatus Argoarchaeum ethanivorans TaxID=2608793 RepID=A0A811T4P9_9EURY|nr:MAG: hypothetical protein LAKADJCE_00268 [Candidatus Argoarchaeum ethanivorans]
MKISSQLKGGIYEVSFRYNSKMERYTNSSSDIPKLYTIQKIFFFLIRNFDRLFLKRGINLFFIFIEGNIRCFLRSAPKTIYL